MLAIEISSGTLSNRSSGISTANFYSRLVDIMLDDVLGKTLCFDENLLINLFKGTFKKRYLDINQKPLAWLCHRSVLCVQVKLSRHRSVVSV